MLLVEEEFKLLLIWFPRVIDRVPQQVHYRNRLLIFGNVFSFLAHAGVRRAVLSNRSSLILTSKSERLDFGRMDYWTVRWLEIWMIGLWTVGSFDYNLIKMTTPLTAVQ